MKRIINSGYPFFILFIIIILIEPIYKIFHLDDNVYNTTRCEFLEQDYNNLLEFNEINYIYESDYINTYIIYKDIYNYMNEITIRGGKDYKFDNNIVLYDNTLVGIIDRVYENSSIVKLITNKDSKISVKINDNIGVLEYKNGELIVSNISVLSNIKEGDDVYTSGIGNTKENIYIGSVKEVIIDSKNIELIIKVKYDLKIKDINYVNVIKESKWFFLLYC